eukprot:366130-Chlamydomonas_euryale.AAC.37
MYGTSDTAYQYCATRISNMVSHESRDQAQARPRLGCTGRSARLPGRHPAGPRGVAGQPASAHLEELERALSRFQAQSQAQARPRLGPGTGGSPPPASAPASPPPLAKLHPAAQMALIWSPSGSRIWRWGRCFLPGTE